MILHCNGCGTTRTPFKGFKKHFKLYLREQKSGSDAAAENTFSLISAWTVINTEAKKDDVDLKALLRRSPD